MKHPRRDKQTPTKAERVRSSTTEIGAWPRTPHIVFPLLGVFRLLILAGVVIRLISHWSQANHTPFWMANKHLVLAFCVVYAICGLAGLYWYFTKIGSSVLQHPVLDEVGRQQSPARGFLWFITLADCVFITAMYAVTMEPESDFYLFYFVPLMTGLLFLPGRDVMRLLGVLVLALTLALALIFSRWEHHVPEVERNWTAWRIIVHVFLLRALALTCACLPLGMLIETNRRLRESEARMQESTELYGSLIRTIPEYIFRKDREKRFQFASDGFCKFLQRSRDKIIGANDYDFFPFELAEKYRKDDDLILSGQEKLLTKEEENQLQQSGKARIVRVTKVPIRGSDGSIVGIQASFLDVTEEKKERHKMLRWFVHDTPKPLVIIRDKHIHTLKNALSAIADEEVRGEAGKACDRVSRIIEFSLACFDAYGFLGDSEQYRWKSGDQDGTVFNLHEVVDIVLLSVKPNEDDIKFHKAIAQNLRIQSDRYKVIAVVFLLVDNAIKATKRSPKEKMEITITMEVVEEALWIRVTDNGCGMTAAVRECATVEGFSEFKSTGLGLAIVNGFAKLAGGSVNFETKEEAGTTVHVKIAKFKIIN